MILIVQERGLARVACFCDACHKEITDARKAMYRWAMGDEECPVGSRHVPHFYHKGPCAESTAKGGSIYPWMELRVFPIFLGENLSVDWPEAWRSARFMSEF